MRQVHQVEHLFNWCQHKAECLAGGDSPEHASAGHRHASARRRCHTGALAGVALIAAVLCGGCAPQIAFAPKASLLGQGPPYTYSDQDWALVLRDYNHHGLVDYAGLARNRDPLDRYYALLGVTGPSATPEQFPSGAQATAYWVNAYNALVVLFVLQQFPTETIYDVALPKIEEATFQVDGRPITLPEIEDRFLASSNGDVRALFATSRGSMGTPRLAAEPLRAGMLERQLAEATTEALSNPRLLRTDHAGRHILVWQHVLTRQDEFLNYLRTRRRVQNVALFSVLLELASPERRRLLQSAVGYTFHPIPFDRALNNWSAETSSDRPLVP